MTAQNELEIRPTAPADRAAALRLLSRALEWDTDVEDQRRFEWEHHENPFGETWGWGAFDGERMVGLRHFLRWEFVARDGSLAAAARPVDTVTDPDYRRRGISRRLALAALAELRARGVRLVFNTPNDESAPGYRSLGWSVVGHWPLAWRAAAVGAPSRLAAARGVSEYPLPASDVGLPAAVAFADAPRVDALLSARSRPCGFETRRSVAFLRWRYAAAPLAYRVMPAGSGMEDGLAIVRARLRGGLRELLICDLLLPAGEDRREAQVLRRLTRVSWADVVARLGGPWVDRRGFVRAPRHGWTVYGRAVSDAELPPRRHWDLTIGDLELF